MINKIAEINHVNRVNPVDRSGSVLITTFDW
jgi:hypothetical protein